MDWEGLIGEERVWEEQKKREIQCPPGATTRMISSQGHNQPP